MRNLTTPRWSASRIYIILLSLFIFGCASVQQPMGGPRDTLPPKVLKMTPKDLTTNFTAEKVVIEFDEYFNLQNEFKEVTISPEMEKPPLLKKKQKRLEITFQEPLAKNTTYTINFGAAIADVNERNILKNFTYVFSTGPILDSLSLSGKVRSAFTGLPEADAVVFLLPTSADTTFGKKKPAIYTRTDTSGYFKLRNLRKDSYRIYALNDPNGDKLYQPGIDEIAFQKDSITLTSNRDSLRLLVFKEEPVLFKVLERKINPDGTILLTFNRHVKNLRVAITNPAALDATKLTRLSKYGDSARIWVNNFDFDSVKVAVSENQALLQTVNITRGKKDTYVRNLTATDNLEGGSLLNPARDLKLTFPLPVTGADISKITLMEDSVQKTDFTVEKDTSDFLSYFFKYPWRQKAKYELRFAEGTFSGILNAKNKYFTKKLQLISSTDYGSLELNITVAEQNKPYILEFITENKFLLFRYAFSRDTVVRINSLRSGKYFMRIIYDNNKNGVWDTGIFSKLLQPETIWYDPNAFSVRPNWDVKQPVEIPKEL